MRYVRVIAFVAIGFFLLTALTACETATGIQIGGKSAKKCPGTELYVKDLSQCPGTATSVPTTPTVSAPVTPAPVVVVTTPTPETVVVSNPTPTAVPAGPTCNPASQGSAVAIGTTLSKGSIAVTEIVDYSAKTIAVFGGTLPVDFPVHNEAHVHYNAWAPYCSPADAASAAQQQAAERKADQQNFAGYTVNLLSSSTASGSSSSSSNTTTTTVVSPVPNGTVLHSGQWVVVERVDFSAGTIKIFGGQLSSDVNVGISGLVHVDAWSGYASAYATKQGVTSLLGERQSEASTSGSWADGMTVTQVQNQSDLGLN